MAHELYAHLSTIGVLPVLTIDDADRAIPTATAVLDGGIPAVEITFRTGAAEEAIRRTTHEVPGTIVGAGTVLTVDQADRARRAGAAFVVTPGFNPRVVAFCQDAGIPVIPGVNNPTQVEQALELGVTVLKFFPAAASGGPAMLRALGGPYPNVRFVPTGGISAANLGEYLGLPNVLAVGGSWMVPAAAVRAGDTNAIRIAVADTVTEVSSVRSGGSSRRY